MAGRTSLANTMMMTRPCRLRETAGDALTAAAAKALFDAGTDVIDRRGDVSDPGAYPPVRPGGVMYAVGGLLRVIAVPTGTALPRLAVYAMFTADDPLAVTAVRIAYAEPAGGSSAASHGAAVLELRDPPGDCRLVALADAAAVIYYSHTV